MDHHAGVRPGFRFAMENVRAAFCLDHTRGYTKSVDTAPIPLVARLIVSQNSGLVAEESRSAGPGMCEQRLGLGEIQVQLLTQERPDLVFDLLGFGARSIEPK